VTEDRKREEGKRREEREEGERRDSLRREKREREKGERRGREKREERRRREKTDLNEQRSSGFALLADSSPAVREVVIIHQRQNTQRFVNKDRDQPARSSGFALLAESFDCNREQSSRTQKKDQMQTNQSTELNRFTDHSKRVSRQA
jgi:hypothetical protein